MHRLCIACIARHVAVPDGVYDVHSPQVRRKSDKFPIICRLCTACWHEAVHGGVYDVHSPQARLQFNCKQRQCNTLLLVCYTSATVLHFCHRVTLLPMRYTPALKSG
jgi:hypothetical protein